MRQHAVDKKSSLSSVQSLRERVRTQRNDSAWAVRQMPYVKYYIYRAVRPMPYVCTIRSRKSVMVSEFRNIHMRNER